MAQTGLTMLVALLGIGMAGCMPAVTVVQNRATITTTGLPADGRIAPGQGLPNLRVAAVFDQPATKPEGWAPEFGQVDAIEVTFTYTAKGGTPASAGPFASAAAWSAFRLPADVAANSTLDVVVTVKSASQQSSVVWLDGVKRSARAEHTETVAKLRVVTSGGGSGGGSGSGSATTPVARIFAHNAPADPSLPALVDARLSSDPNGQALTFSWDLNGDGQFGDATDGGSGSTPEQGLAYVSPATMAAEPTQYQTVAVRVTAADGRSGTTSIRFRKLLSGALGNGSVVPSPAAAPAGSTITLTVNLPSGSDLRPIDGTNRATACLDTNGDGVYGDAILRFTTASPQTVTLAGQAAAGFHRVGAVIWWPSTNEDCANRDGESLVDRYAGGFIQLISNAYQTTGAASRQGAAKQYTAASRLRLNPIANPVPGTVAGDGTVRGIVTRGTFTFATPAASRKVRRPDGLADLARGTYVARAATSAISGTGQSGKAVYTGASTVLLRGRNGTLACLTVNASIANSVLTMRGGTGSASRLVFTANQIQTPFTLPTLAEFARQNRAKTPPKARPVIGRGPITASTGAKPRPLNAACRGLQRHLR